MKLAKTCTFIPNSEQSLVLGHLTYAAWKLWNVANYERKTWVKGSGRPYPNWYEQKKRLKTHIWYKNLPSQSAQELLAVLDRSWSSFYKLKETGGVKNPKPPKYKQERFNVKYLKDGFTVLAGNRVRLAIPRQLRYYLKEKFGFKQTYLYLDVPNHLKLETAKVKTLELKPLSGGKYELIAVVQIPDQIKEPKLSDKFMCLDFGVNNFLTCYLYDGSSHIFSGRQLLSINRYFDKTISYYDSLSDSQQAAKGVKYPRQSKRVAALYEKRRKQIKHLLHTMTRAVVDLAAKYGVETIVLGDITGIRDNKNLGIKTNQKFHKWPFYKAAEHIRYKAAVAGIAIVSITEEYTSQTCSVCQEMPSKENARKSNRKYRGLYVCQDCGAIINADVNGARNIAKKYLETLNKRLPVVGLGSPRMYRFNGLKFVA